MLTTISAQIYLYVISTSQKCILSSRKFYIYLHEYSVILKVRKALVIENNLGANKFRSLFARSMAINSPAATFSNEWIFRRIECLSFSPHQVPVHNCRSRILTSHTSILPFHYSVTYLFRSWSFLRSRRVFAATNIRTNLAKRSNQVPIRITSFNTNKDSPLTNSTSIAIGRKTYSFCFCFRNSRKFAWFDISTVQIKHASLHIFVFNESLICELICFSLKRKHSILIALRSNTLD